VRYRGKVIKSIQKQGINNEKSTKYAIRSLNNGDFSKKMAFFEHVLGGVLYPPAYYYSFKHISKMSNATDFKFVERVHVDIFSKRTNKNPV